MRQIWVSGRQPGTPSKAWVRVRGRGAKREPSRAQSSWSLHKQGRRPPLDSAPQGGVWVKAAVWSTVTGLVMHLLNMFGHLPRSDRHKKNTGGKIIKNRKQRGSLRMNVIEGYSDVCINPAFTSLSSHIYLYVLQLPWQRSFVFLSFSLWYFFPGNPFCRHNVNFTSEVLYPAPAEVSLKYWPKLNICWTIRHVLAISNSKAIWSAFFL